MKFFIRNMGCECCKVLVKDELEKLGLHLQRVDLGEAEITGEVTEKKKEQFNKAIKKAGLEIIENKRGILLEKIKRVIYDYVHKSTERQSVNLSGYLSRELHYDYAYLANFFSEMQATTIEKYLINLKVERIKELILYNEFTFTEIAYKLHYSSVAHLSSQFKKVTGLTPTQFRKLKQRRFEFTNT